MTKHYNKIQEHDYFNLDPYIVPQIAWDDMNKLKSECNEKISALGITLPVASAFTIGSNVTGIAVASTPSSLCGAIVADTVNDIALLTWQAVASVDKGLSKSVVLSTFDKPTSDFVSVEITNALITDNNDFLDAPLCDRATNSVPVNVLAVGKSLNRFAVI